MNIKIKRLAIGLIAISMASTALVSCGSVDKDTSDSASSTPFNLGDGHETEYTNYVTSFTAEVGTFVENDLKEILSGVAGLNSSNYSSWKEKYSSALEKTEHWYNECSSAEMFCPGDKQDEHQALVMTVATINKVLSGMSDAVECADNGDFSIFLSKGADYADASDIVTQMWDRAVAELNI